MRVNSRNEYRRGPGHPGRDDRAADPEAADRGDVRGERVLDGVAAEPAASAGGERLAWLAVPLGHPNPKIGPKLGVRQDPAERSGAGWV
jgi:hypothetical protein